LASRAGDLFIANRGDFAGAPFQGLTAQFAPQSDRLPLDDAEMRRLQEHALLDLFLNMQLGQLPQKFLLSRFASLLRGIHAWAPST
jgi:hypothetical protein